MFSVACLCCYCCLVPSRRGGGAARTHCLSRDRAPVERVDQWGGGIAAAEARPSARVGGLVPARASLLGGGAPEPRGQPGNPRRTGDSPAFASMQTRDSRSLGFLCPPLLSPLLLVPLPGRRAHARRPTWAVMDSGATVGGTRERAASSGKGHVEGKFSRARPRGYRALSLSLFIGWEGLFWILLYIISPRVDGIHSSNVYFLRNISLL